MSQYMTPPKPGQVWLTEYPTVPARRVVSAGPWQGYSFIVRYVRGKEGGERRCSMRAWIDWATDNKASPYPGEQA